jgi:glycosyltransferase involved in cell wall biosynthesis
MIISFTCNNIGTGGAERVICNLANQMAKDGHFVNIICYKVLPSFYYKLQENVKIIELDDQINSRKRWIDRKTAGLVNLKKLYGAVKSSDCIVSFYTRQNCYSILVGKLQHIPVICAERDHFFMVDGRVNHWMRKVFYPHADGFIHQTSMAQTYLRKNEGVKCQDVVIPNPLWISDFPTRKPIPGRVVSVGRLAEQKNYDGIIAAFADVHSRFPNSELWIYGDGDLKKQLEKKCSDYNIQKSVVFAGVTKNVVDALLSADIFVMFSHGEGYPNSLMEALAVGVPSISSDCPVGGPRDMIANGENGFLVECGDVQQLSNSICELLGNDTLKQLFSQRCISIRQSNEFMKIYSMYMDYITTVSQHKTEGQINN